MSNSRRQRRNILLILNVILFLLFTFNIEKFKMITIVYDEFGYWANAAYLTGKDWSGMASLSPYYSYGYSLLLVPLFLLLENPVLMYRVALLMNTLMLLMAFNLLCSCGYKILGDRVKYYIICGAAFLAVFNPAYIMNSHFAWSECIQVLIVIILFWSALKFENSFKTIYIIMLAFFSIYGYMVHQRNIGLILAGCLFVAINVCHKKITFKQTFAFVLTLIMMFGFHCLIKNYLSNGLWRGVGEAQMAINNFSGQTSKVMGLLSAQGLFLLIVGFIGRFYYASVGTVGLAYVGLGNIIKKIRIADCIKSYKIEKNIDSEKSNGIIFLFLFTMVLFETGIAVIYMLWPGRIDSFVYGRYIEHTFAPVIFWGIVGLYMEKNYIKKLFVWLFAGSCAAFVLYGMYKVWQNQGYTFVAAPLIDYFYNMDSDYTYVFTGMIISTILFIVIIISLKKNINKGYIIVMLVSFIFFSSSGKSLDNQVLYMQEHYNDSMVAKKYIDTQNENLDIFCVDVENTEFINYWYKIGILQFLLPEATIHPITYENIEDVEPDALLIVWNEAGYIDKLVEKYNIVESVLGYSILKIR